MNFKIEVIDCTKETKPTSNGKSYDILTVTYKHLGTGKIEAKKLVSFGASVAAYTALENASKGSVYEIEAEKGEKYWEWRNASKSVGGGESPKAASATSYKSTYETPEERAQRQLMIVRQSSIANAIALLGNKGTLDSVLQTAQAFVEYVVNGPSAYVPKAVSPTLDDLEDDIPL